MLKSVISDGIKSVISDGIIRYAFDPLPGKHFGNNIIAIIDVNKALLIDTAYEFQAKQVFQDILDSGLEIVGIIISHFHDDHMQGLKVLPKVPVYGSEHFQTTLDMWTEKEDHKDFTPSVLVKDVHSMDFGKHKITMIPFPGHSLCTLITKVDDNYLHIADEMMFSNEGIPILPSADPNCIERHVSSLERLKTYSNSIFIPGHGPIYGGIAKIEKDINNRIAYFKTILTSHSRITYEEAIKNCDCGFLHSEWHEYAYG